jgi:hypothetical protein
VIEQHIGDPTKPRKVEVTRHEEHIPSRCAYVRGHQCSR